MKNKLIQTILILLIFIPLFAKITSDANTVKNDRKYANIVLNQTFKFNNIEDVSIGEYQSLDDDYSKFSNDIAKIKYAGFDGVVYAKSSDGLIYGIKLTRGFKEQKEMRRIVISLKKKYKQISKSVKKKVLSKEKCQDIYMRTPMYALLHHIVISNISTDVQKAEAQKAIDSILKNTKSNTTTTTTTIFDNQGDQIKVIAFKQSVRPISNLTIIYFSKESLRDIEIQNRKKAKAKEVEKHKITQELQGL